MGESTTIVIIVIIMMVIGFAFYAYVKADNIKEDQRMLEEYNAIQLTLIASNVPELFCTTKGSATTNCYDLLKIYALKKLIQDSLSGTDQSAYFYYSDLFGNSEINITVIYPGAEENILLYSNVENETESYNMMRIPTVLYDALDETRRFGVITIKKHY